jgi:hypothetical protein
MSDSTENEMQDAPPPRPDGPYWEDPVYRHVSRRHRAATSAGCDAEAARLDALMRQLVNASMPDDLYWQLDAEARAERNRQRRERKRQPKPPPTHEALAGRATQVNVADLKKRIFNPRVSRDNVVKALEALPSAERKATIASLPPGLRRKLGGYLKGRGH